MNILAIETSCDETSCAVLCGPRNILSNITYSQIETHKIYGGIVPEIASRIHIEVVDKVFNKALEKASKRIEDIDLISATYAPGLVGSLLVGLNFAKGLSMALDIPFLAIHHIRGHIASAYLCNKNLKPPFLSLVISGGHTLIVHVKGYVEFEIISTTVDDAVGEAYDKIGRALGLDYPGGVYIDKISKYGNENAFVLPDPKTENELDFSFSGLKTACLNLINNSIQRGDKLNVCDLAASFQKRAVSMLISRTIIASKKLNVKDVAICGGVSANSKLRQDMEDICRREGIKLHLTDLDLCGDNAAMIGCQAYYEYLNGNVSHYNVNAVSNKSII